MMSMSGYEEPVYDPNKTKSLKVYISTKTILKEYKELITAQQDTIDELRSKIDSLENRLDFALDKISDLQKE